jgi:hypothetical protein
LVAPVVFRTTSRQGPRGQHRSYTLPLERVYWAVP